MVKAVWIALCPAVGLIFWRTLAPRPSHGGSYSSAGVASGRSKNWSSVRFQSVMTIHVPRSECSDAERALIVYDPDTVIKWLPLCGLRGEILAFDRDVAISAPAVSRPSLVR